MKMPTHYIEKTEWTLVGPMGPHVPSSLLSHALLGVDGGADFAPRLDLWVGDSDSLKGGKLTPHAFIHPSEKDFSDLALGLSLFERTLPYRLHLWGFLGGRKDHELFNLGEGMAFLSGHPGSKLLFYGPNQRVDFILFGAGDWQIQHQGLFSLGVLNPASVELSGECRYPIPKGRVITPLSSFGLSNEASGELRLRADSPFFLCFPEEK